MNLFLLPKLFAPFGSPRRPSLPVARASLRGRAFSCPLPQEEQHAAAAAAAAAATTARSRWIKLFIMPDFFRFKNGPRRQKFIVLCDSKRSSFITDFFELQFDPATLIIQSFRMVEARGCKQRFKSDLLCIFLIPGRMRISMQYYYLQYESSIARPRAAVLMT